MLSIKHAGLYVSALQNLTCTDTESEALTDGNNAIYQNIMDSLISTVGMGIICGSVELVILENADICIHALLQKALAWQIQRSCCIISLIFNGFFHRAQAEIANQFQSTNRRGHTTRMTGCSGSRRTEQSL